ncbi:MAG: ROK family transcriptional regulator [Acidobacteriaceae bacterium]|nr:ROK family transcriptional regulator [Acidobacteriaceae bacterium]
MIRCHQPITRADLARITGFFRSSVSDIVDELIADDLVIEERAVPTKRGRVPMSLGLNDATYRVLGLNIRPRQCQLAYAGLSGTIQQTWTFPTPGSSKKLVQSIGKAITNAREALGMSRSEKFERLGIAIPGHVDVATGCILWTPTHPELSNFPIADEITKELGIPATADNDCNVGALSELWLTKKERVSCPSEFVFLNVSDFGTGAGAVIHGEVYLGHDAHFAAEVGHMIIKPGGDACRCGRNGCWERYVSNFATWARYKKRTPYDAELFELMLDGARNGDNRARQAILETAHYLGLGLSNLIFFFNPSEVVLAGRIAKVWDLIEDDVRHAFSSPQLHYSIRPAKCSADDSLLHGAVCLALRGLFTAPKFG